ncbi:MAG: YmdB family metallophosphoesterase [Oscillospiraceae bacterium]|nr:YmdB family metallophosphoesterase [Oscillospiraceae bacterium]
MPVRILAAGDVVGQSGADLFERRLRSLKKLKGIDFTVVNGENASGIGITRRQAEQLLDAGADVITLGNHAFGRTDILEYLDDEGRILRPANFAPQTPGRGWGVFPAAFGEVLVINLIGRCGMDFGPDNPFFEADRILKAEKRLFTLVDFHAEASSEKLAMAFYLDGRVSALWGTHTHVQTSDACVMPAGSGYITDLGMTGPRISVLGMNAEQSVSNFLGNPKRRMDPAPGPCKLECAVFELDERTGLCLTAEALRIED